MNCKNSSSNAGLLLAVFLALAVSFCQSCKKPGSLPDSASQASGTAKPARIISLAPAHTELLYALGLGEQVLAVSNYCQYPPAVKSLPKVGALLDPNLEAILRLQPDYVLLYAKQAALAEQLRRLGLRPLLMPGNKLADIYESIELLGQSFEQQEQAQSLLTNMRERFARLQYSRPVNISSPSVLLVVWRERGLGTLKNISVAGNDGFYSEMLQAIGAKLLPADMKLEYPSLGPESILLLNPDIIIEIAPELAAKEPAALQNAKDDWRRLPELKAYQNKNIYILTDDFMALPSARCIMAAEKLAETIAQAQAQAAP